MDSYKPTRIPVPEGMSLDIYPNRIPENELTPAHREKYESASTVFGTDYDTLFDGLDAVGAWNAVHKTGETNLTKTIGPSLVLRAKDTRTVYTYRLQSDDVGATAYLEFIG